MDRSSNDRISILFTESHKILSNSINGYGMYEIHMNGGIKRILYFILKLEFVTDTTGKGLRNFT